MAPKNFATQPISSTKCPPRSPPRKWSNWAVQLITNKSSKFAPEKYEDHYQTALQELVEAKLKGRRIIAPPEEARPLSGNVVDLMEALKIELGPTFQIAHEA